jgi:hypothetical protein
MHTVEHNRLAAGSIVENKLQQNRGGEKIALPFARLNVEIQAVFPILPLAVLLVLGIKATTRG